MKEDAKAGIWIRFVVTSLCGFFISGIWEHNSWKDRIDAGQDEIIDLLREIQDMLRQSK
jgi:hypothetical protein